MGRHADVFEGFFDLARAADQPNSQAAGYESLKWI